MILGYILRLPNNPSLVLVIITKKIALHRCKAIFFMVGRAVNFAKAVLTYTALPLLNFFKAFLKLTDSNRFRIKALPELLFRYSSNVLASPSSVKAK